LELPDGDFIDLDFLTGDTSLPFVLILHGLEGSGEVRYVRSLLGEIQKNRWQACVMNFRGCSGSLNRLRESYHSGKTEDLDVVLDYLTRHYSAPSFFAVGYSLGGNLLLKWLGEQSQNASSFIQKTAAFLDPSSVNDPWETPFLFQSL